MCVEVNLSILTTSKTMRRCDIKKKGLFADTVLSTLEPEDKDYRLKDSQQLYFLVKKCGKKSWQLRYKNSKGKWTWLGLGAYPKVKASSARAQARGYLSDLDAGKSIDDRHNNEGVAYQDTLQALMESWLSSKLVGKHKWQKNTHLKAKQSIAKHIYPVFGERNFRDIKYLDWYQFFFELQQKDIHTQIKKLYLYVKNSYEWTLNYCNERINPLFDLGKALKINSAHDCDFDDNVLSFEDLPQLFRSIHNYRNEAVSIALLLLSHLVIRPSELRFAQWDEFDLDSHVWTIPAHRMKNRLMHKVPLSAQAVELLLRLKSLNEPSCYLFPSRSNMQKCISENTLNAALQRMGYKNLHTAHRFRHIFSTYANETHSDKSQVIECCLSHKKHGVKGRYDKATHFEERRDLMQWWSNQLPS